MIGRRFDDHGQLHGRRFHFHRGLGIGVKRAVDDVRPIDKIGQRRGIEAETLLRDHGDETGARLEIRIVKLAVALTLLKMLGIGRRKKCALMMVEPPRDFRRTGIFEVNDGVLITVKFFFVEQGAGAVHQSGKDEFSIAANALAIETREQGGGGSSVETLIVIENSYSQAIPQLFENASPQGWLSNETTAQG